jgi:hypothetical protein
MNIIGTNHFGVRGMAGDLTQMSIDIKVKNTLDRFKAKNKEIIIEKYGLSKRIATNSWAIQLLLDIAKEHEGPMLVDNPPKGKNSKKSKN